LSDVSFVIEQKALEYINGKGAEAITIHGPAFGCPCCSPGSPARATLNLPASRLDIYHRYSVQGIVIYFPKGAYNKLSSKRTVRIVLEGFWFIKSLAVYGFSFTY